MTSSPSPSVHAILGMHRSGTSWLAGSLEEQGLALGEVSTEDPHNRKGNRESPELMALHDGVLRANDGSWKKPPRRSRWSDEQRASLADFVARMNDAYPVWGFKDPRALLLFDEWRRHVPDIRCVGIFRHPLAVHRSLHARNPRFDERRSVKLWIAYNERLVEEHRRDPFPILRFDVAPESLAQQLVSVVGTLDLPGGAADAGFFDPSLVHQDAAPELPRAARKLWSVLCDNALAT